MTTLKLGKITTSQQYSKPNMAITWVGKRCIQGMSALTLLQELTALKLSVRLRVVNYNDVYCAFTVP